MWPLFSEPDSLHLSWCPPIASIYLQTTFHYSLWLNKTQFLNPFINYRASGLFS
jgi:hypothetical protein